MEYQNARVYEEMCCLDISFIWIENFQDGLLKDQGFNFDNCFRYECKRKLDNEFELKIKSNPNYIEHFFVSKTDSRNLNANIRNVTAIVGQNGVGKSSILDFIKQSVVNSDNDEEEEEVREQDKFLYILHKKEGDESTYLIYHHPQMKVHVEISTKTHFSYRQYEVSRVFKNFHNTSFIYFSNIHDFKDEYVGEKLLNISTNYLSAVPSFRPTREGFIDSEGMGIKFGDIKRQIQFILGVKNTSELKSLSFTLPVEVDISISQKRNMNSSRISRRTGDESSIPLLDEIVDLENERRMRNMNFSGRYTQFLMGVFLNHLFAEILRDRRRGNESYWEELKNLDYESYTACSRNNVNKNEIYRVIRWVLGLTYSFKKTGNPEFIEISEILKTSVLLFIKLYKYSREGRIKSGKGQFLSISLTMNEIEHQNFINLYENAFLYNDFIRFSWRNMSSGENAMLNIYSRFYFAAKKLEASQEPENDLVILIDEGEVYLHPHWQSQLLNNLIEYLPLIFNNNNRASLKQRNIQIILTSNSPFIISDLPSTSVVFLKKEKEKSIVLNGLDDYNQTFAANIHSLLAHSFFMEDGLMGAFAKRKINDLIYLLVNESVHDLLPREKEIEKTINIIGEPVIRNKLSQMLSDKLSIRMLSVDYEIKKLQSRLEELEKWKHDTDQTR